MKEKKLQRRHSHGFIDFIVHGCVHECLSSEVFDSLECYQRFTIMYLHINTFDCA